MRRPLQNLRKILSLLLTGIICRRNFNRHMFSTSGLHSSRTEKGRGLNGIGLHRSINCHRVYVAAINSV